MAEISSIRQKAKDLIRQPASLVSGPFYVSDPEFDRFINRAINRLSQDTPRVLVEDVTGDGTKLLPLPSGWVDGASVLMSIETPPASLTFLDRREFEFYVDLVTVETDPGPPPVTEVRQVPKLALPGASSASYRVKFSAPYQGVAQVSVVDEDAVSALVASYVCESLAAKAAGMGDSTVISDSVNYRDSQLRYTQEAEKFLAMYETHVGSSKGVSPASGFINWDNPPSGGMGDRLVHRRRFL